MFSIKYQFKQSKIYKGSASVWTLKVPFKFKVICQDWGRRRNPDQIPLISQEKVSISHSLQWRRYFILEQPRIMEREQIFCKGKGRTGTNESYKHFSPFSLLQPWSPQCKRSLSRPDKTFAIPIRKKLFSDKGGCLLFLSSQRRGVMQH